MKQDGSFETGKSSTNVIVVCLLVVTLVIAVAAILGGSYLYLRMRRMQEMAVRAREQAVMERSGR